MSKESFEEFSDLVLGNFDLQQKLQTPNDLESFLALTVQLGNEHGYAFTTEDVAIAYNKSRRAWFERWLDQ